MDSRNHPFTSKISRLCHHTDGRTLPASLNSNDCVFLLFLWQSEVTARLCQQRKERLSSLARAQFAADVSQLHSNFITETFAEIMIKTLASCNFKVIRDILAWIFFPFAITYQSSTRLADLPLFKQLTSLAARKALDLNLASPRRHVFFITFQPIMYASQSQTRHDDFLSLHWKSWMFSQVWLRL